MVNEGSGQPENVASRISMATKTGRTLGSGVTSICRVMNILGVTVLMGMTAMTVIDVIGRLFKRPIIGSTEITEFMMVTIVFLCIGWAAIKGKMITVDLVTMKFSSRVQAILNCITLFIGLGVVIVITWRSFLATLDIQSDNVFTIILQIPHAPFMWILSAGFVVLCLAMAMLLVQNIIKAAGK